MKHWQQSTVKTVKYLFISVVLGLPALTAFAGPAAPVITTQPVSAVVVLGQAASLSVTNGGTAPFGYQWLKDGVILTGQTNSTLTYAAFQFTNSGSYYVVITNAEGLAISYPASLSVSNAPLRAWGNNGAGELGNGTDGVDANTNLPITVTNNVVAMAAGGSYSLFVKADGTLWAMGYNDYGQLGNGTWDATNLPIQVTNGVVAVAAGYEHSLFVKADGTLWAMGYNEDGELGNGKNISTNLPITVTNNVVAVAAGAYHSLFVKSDGTLWAMGYNRYGELGNATNGSSTSTNLPIQVTNNVVAVAAGGYHSLFVKADGSLWAMGNNESGQLGNGNNTDTNLPTYVASNVVAVAAGYGHSLFVKSDGTLWAMGDNQSGQLGNGTNGVGVYTNLPTYVTNNVVTAAAGAHHSLFMKADGTLWAMGYNDYGELGNGTTTETNRPVLVNNGGLLAASLAKEPMADHSLAIAATMVTATILPSNGPFAGGNRVVVTNVSANIGNGDITNITIGGVTATDFAVEGTNWVTFIAPAVGSAGAKDIVIQSTSESATTLSGAYTVNPAGTIYDNVPVGWSSRAGLPIGLKHFAAVTYSNAIYTLGGQDSGAQAVTNVFRFDGTSWTSVAGLPVSNYYQGADVYSGAVYSVGGYNAECFYGMTNAYRYDGTSWAEVAGLPKGGTNWGFHSQAVKSFGGYLYSMGGYYYVFGPQTNVYRYNGSLWQEVAGLPAVGMNASAAVLGANLYYMGGGLVSALTNVYRFDGSTWSPVAGLPVARMNMACLQRESAIYVAGGLSDSLFATTNVYRFDGTNWQEMVGLPRAFANGAGAVLNDMMYVLGGDDYGGYATTSVYRYAQGSVGVSPTSGSLTGGYQVVISGTNLCNGTIGDVTSVTLCGVAAFVTGVSGSTQIVVTAGAAAVAGLGNVAVYSTSYGITIKSKIFTYTGPVMDVLGTNGAAIASGEAASANKGTDFGTFLFGAAPVTNTFAATNSGNQTLNITLLTTNGSPLFQCSSIPASIAAGTASNFFIVFNPSAAGVATVSIAIANNSGVTPFVLNVKGAVNGAETNLPAPTGVSATDGTYTNRVRVTWLGVAGATSYEILRNTTDDANGATFLADVPAAEALRLTPTAYSLQSTVYYYDDLTVVRRLSYYYWLRAISGSVVSALSYVGMGYAELGSGQTIGRADLTVSDMVFLPVNLTNGSPAGTVSYRLANGGPDMLTAAPVRFDFYMVQSNQAVWMAYNETNVTLAVGAEQLIVLDAVARQWLRVRGDLAGQYTVQARVRHLDSMEDGHTGSNMTDAAGTVRVKASGVNSPGRSANDYDGDGKSDGCLYQGTLGRWYMELSGDRYGADPSVGDVGMGWTPVPGDYDGDGITDVAAYNRLSGQWLVKFTSNGLLGECWLGGPEFTAAPCDFDGDAMTDPMVYREADGYVEGAASTKQYALYDAFLNVAGYQWVRGDFDGDGLADLAAYNRTTGLWAIGFSSIGYRILTGTFGGSGYLPVPADYDGDGKTDPAVYAPGTAYWQVLFSRSLETQGVYTWCDAFMGTIGGIPVPADYDGDGRADPAVYHQGTGIWELFPSTQGYQLVWGLFGGPAYQPVME